MEKEANKWVTLKRGEYLINISDEIYRVFIHEHTCVTVNDVSYPIEFRKIKDDVYSLNVGPSSYEMTLLDIQESKKTPPVRKLSSQFSINVNGSIMQAIVDDQRSLVAQSWMQRKPHRSKSNTLRAPMPGLITKVIVQQGEIVQRGGVMLVLEAMKMENEIRALQQCKIELVLVQPGATVERNDELLRILEM